MSIDPTSGPRDVLAALRDGRIQGADSRLRASAQLMEGVFYQQLFKAMRDTVPEGDLISGGQGQEMFEGLLDERMAESAATRSEVGLGQALYRHFSRHIQSEPAVAAADSKAAGVAAEQDPAVSISSKRDIAEPSSKPASATATSKPTGADQA